MSKRVFVVGVLLGAMCFGGCGATPDTAEPEAEPLEIGEGGMGLLMMEGANQSGLSPFSFGSPEPQPFVPDAPLPDHIDIEALLDKLAPLEPYLIWPIDEMKAFTWGEDKIGLFDESLYLRIEGREDWNNSLSLSFLEDRLRSISFFSSALFQDSEFAEDVMTQTEFYDLVQKILAIYEVNLEITPEDCRLVTRHDDSKEWIAAQGFEVEGVPYIDCGIRITAYASPKALKSVQLDIPNNPPPNLTPALGEEEAVRSAQSIAWASGYFMAPRRSQILLYGEPELYIVDRPWTLAFSSYQWSKYTPWPRLPTVSWEAPELRKARLYWYVSVYPNADPEEYYLTRVENLMIDAITGDLLHTYMYPNPQGDIDPTIPLINPYEFVVLYLFPYWFPILFALVVLCIYTGKFLRRRIRAYRKRKALAANPGVTGV